MLCIRANQVRRKRVTRSCTRKDCNIFQLRWTIQIFYYYDLVSRLTEHEHLLEDCRPLIAVNRIHSVDKHETVSCFHDTLARTVVRRRPTRWTVKRLTTKSWCLFRGCVTCFLIRRCVTNCYDVVPRSSARLFLSPESRWPSTTTGSRVVIFHPLRIDRVSTLSRHCSTTSK